MNLSLSMEFVLLRAAQEASAFSDGRMSLEHLFLGILKMPEVKGEDVVKDKARTEEFDLEAEEVRRIAVSNGWDTGALRMKLRGCLSGERLPQNTEEQISLALGSAAYHAQKDRGSDSVTAADVLGAILRHPSPMITAVLSNEQIPSAEGDPDEGHPEDELPPEAEGIAFLPQLTARVRAMRYELLNKIYGQNHAVQSLAEGVFSAEVLAASNTERKGPRAVFVFAGSPGVGKTYTAECAAKALKLPYKRFDMSSYADHQAHLGLIGFAPSFKDAKPGALTGFVAAHPRCLLLIDEVEKANKNTIQLFLQILDGGRLHDDYTDKDVGFCDTMIIFTTNAGRQLYDDHNTANPATMPRQSVISALENDVDPVTKQPFFPAAICSRLSTGYVILFGHLNAHDRRRICETELNRFCALFERQYGIRASFDRLLPAALLFSEGVRSDARTLRAQTELFCKNEIYHLCGLWGEDSFEDALKELRDIRFTVDTDDVPEDVRRLFVNPDIPEILYLGNDEQFEGIQNGLPGFRVLYAHSPEEAYHLAGAAEPLLLLTDLDWKNDRDELSLFDDPMEDDWDDAITTRLLSEDDSSKMILSFESFSAAPANIHGKIAFLKELRERVPDLPVYLLESERLRLDEENMNAFSRIGVRGKILAPTGDLGVFSEQLQEMADECYLQNKATSMGAEHQILSFVTETVLSQDNHTAAIRLTELKKKRAVNAEDVGDLLDDVERSSVMFDDVIGAEDAKEELRFFVDYLRNPKKFMSRGLKSPKGILLYGPPGTGKTLLARAMAGEAEVAFIATEATNFVTKWQGSGPESIRSLFRKARRYAPCIVFIDEIDAIGRTRGQGNSGHGEEMALNALLTEMDGFRVDPRRPVFVLAATNYSVDPSSADSRNSIDPALSRRFDRKILVELPTRDQRKLYLERMIGSGSQVTPKMIDRMADRSAGMSLADLSAILEYAVRIAVRKNLALADEDLDDAFESSRHGSEKSWGADYMERVAYHESGHALLCALSGRTPAYLTIVARSSHGGYMEYADTEDTPLRTRDELSARIRTALGGRAAEIVRYGETDGVSTGASGDLTSATRLAGALLLQYGMDGEFGLASFDADSLLRGPMAEKIIAKINVILDSEMQNAIETLKAHRNQLDLLADTLLQKNKLTGDEIDDLLQSLS